MASHRLGGRTLRGRDTARRKLYIEAFLWLWKLWTESIVWKAVPWPKTRQDSVGIGMDQGSVKLAGVMLACYILLLLLPERAFRVFAASLMRILFCCRGFCLLFRDRCPHRNSWLLCLGLKLCILVPWWKTYHSRCLWILRNYLIDRLWNCTLQRPSREKKGTLVANEGRDIQVWSLRECNYCSIMLFEGTCGLIHQTSALIFQYIHHTAPYFAKHPALKEQRERKEEELRRKREEAEEIFGAHGKVSWKLRRKVMHTSHITAAAMPTGNERRKAISSGAPRDWGQKPGATEVK